MKKKCIWQKKNNLKNNHLSCRRIQYKSNSVTRSAADSTQQHCDSDDDDEVDDSTPEREPEKITRYPKRVRVPRVSTLAQYQMGTTTAKKPRKPRKRDDDELNKMDTWYSWYKWSDCKLAAQYDKERHFLPQPGPSNLNYYEDDKLIGYYRPVTKHTTKINESISKSVDNVERSVAKKRLSNTPPQRKSSRKAKLQKFNDGDLAIVNGISSPNLSEDSDCETDIHMQSFYEQSFIQNAPTPTPSGGFLTCDESDDDIYNGNNSNSQAESLANTTISTPVISKFLENLKNSSSELKVNRLRPQKQNEPNDRCTIKPSKRAPHPSDVNNVLNSHELPKVIHSVPFYSDPNDVIANNSKKEIGHTVLQLTSNSVADCDEFQSELNVVGIGKWQRLIGMRAIRCSQRILDGKVLQNENTIRKEKSVLISPSYMPPTKDNVNKWLDMRAQLNIKKRTIEQQKQMMNGHDHDDSPQKIRREKAIAALIEQNDDIEDVSPTINDSKDELMRVLRSKKDITVSMVPKRGKAKILKSQSDNENKIQTDSDDDNDVVCLDDESITIKRQPANSVTKLVRSTR